jgi:hypothetical protein
MLKHPIKYWQGKGTLRVGKMPSKNKHFNWQGGKSFEPYNFEFNKKLKEKIKNANCVIITII